MSLSPPVPTPYSDTDRLNGWKEIAAFLGKGVRTAQRWEREFGLPVRRLGANGGEIVFASREEIARWMQSVAHTRADGAAADEADGAAPADRQAPNAAVPDAAFAGTAGVETTEERGRSSRARRWGTAAVALAALAAGAAWVGERGPSAPGAAPQPVGWRVENDRLTVVADGNRDLWSFRPGWPLLRHAYERQSDGSDRLHPSPVEIADVDGDSSREVIFTAVGADTTRSVLYVLNGDGSVRFSRAAPTTPFRFGGTEHQADWTLEGFWTTTDRDNQLSIWLPYRHRPFFPSLLVQLDPFGRVLSQYMSNGYIVHVSAAEWKGKEVVLVGAANNETRGGSLAIFEGRTVRGSAPAEDPDYRCTTCPAGGPDAFLVFPRTCLSLAPGDTARVGHAWVGKDDTVWADVHHGTFRRADPTAGAVVYVFDRDLRPSKAEFGGTYVALHREELEARGLVDHPVGPRDEAMAFPVRAWNGTRFEALPTAPVVVDR